MSSTAPKLTPTLERSLVAYVRAGAFPHVAAEAAGVPRAVFADWLARDRGPYRAFALSVTQAHAQSRCVAEIAIHDTKPLDWLKCGPGRPAPDRPGWTAAARAPVNDSQAGSPLADPEVQRFLAGLLRSLEPTPESRATVADHVLPLIDAHGRSNRA